MNEFNKMTIFELENVSFDFGTYQLIQCWNLVFRLFYVKLGIIFDAVYFNLKSINTYFFAIFLRGLT